MINKIRQRCGAAGPDLSHSPAGPRVALVNDWLVHVRGQERVFQVLCEMFPTSDIYTLVYDPDQMPAIYRDRIVRSSFIQHLPGSRRRFRVYLPLYPLAARSINLTDYDVVIASTSAFIHGVSVGPQTVVLCYCHSPFRYIWSHWNLLVRRRLGAFSATLLPARYLLQKWDVKAASRVDQYIAPSRFIQGRIAEFYRRDSTVIPPGVDLNVFTLAPPGPRDYYLIVSPLMSWKRVDLAIQAFNRLGLPLKVVGDGEESHRLKALAKDNVEFVGARTHREVHELAQLYGRCRALILPSEEDFGLTALEAMACGRPVIALGRGGALETVVDGVSGRFFDNQSSDALAAAVTSTDCDRFDPKSVRRTAEAFGVETFKGRLMSEVIGCIGDLGGA